MLQGDCICSLSLRERAGVRGSCGAIIGFEDIRLHGLGTALPRSKDLLTPALVRFMAQARREREKKLYPY